MINSETAKYLKMIIEMDNIRKKINPIGYSSFLLKLLKTKDILKKPKDSSLT